jgi:hypothetical protein
MSEVLSPKYSTEFVLEFLSEDRFLYRISDLYELKELIDQELLRRLEDCHLYLLAKRARISIMPESFQTTDEAIRFIVEYKRDGVQCRSKVDVPRRLVGPDEVFFEASAYPHRELVSRNSTGEIVARTLLANYAHLIPEIEESARDLEVMYVGKGLSRSANDRMANHATLQKILAHIHSNEPDAEVFALAYAFQYRKNAISLLSVQAEIRGDAAKQRRQRALDYKPKLEEQVSLIEASVISYFRPDFNEHYLGFPDGKERILRGVYNADFAAILVQLDNTNIGGPRVYSKKVPPRAVHEIVVDFRQLEGKFSFFGKR